MFPRIKVDYEVFVNEEKEITDQDIITLKVEIFKQNFQ